MLVVQKGIVFTLAALRKQHLYATLSNISPTPKKVSKVLQLCN